MSCLVWKVSFRIRNFKIQPILLSYRIFTICVQSGKKMSLMSEVLFYYFSCSCTCADVLLLKLPHTHTHTHTTPSPPPTQKTSLESCCGGAELFLVLPDVHPGFVFSSDEGSTPFSALACSISLLTMELLFWDTFCWKTQSLMLQRSYWGLEDYYVWEHIFEKGWDMIGYWRNGLL